MNGTGMFVHQGALAFEKWTGIRPNTEKMIEKITETLEVLMLTGKQKRFLRSEANHLQPLNPNWEKWFNAMQSLN